MKKASLVLVLVCCFCLLTGCSGSGSTPLTATHFSVTAVGNAVVGTAFKITVTALDGSNNMVSTYSGTVHFTSSDAQAALPSASTLTGGTGTFSVTLMTPGAQTITATDTSTASLTGTSNSITVADVATHFSLTVPSNSTQGIAFNVTVTALDAANNIFAGYTGTVHFTSSDAQASLPSNSALTNGTGTFSATLKTLGSQTITATDTLTASITGTSSGITVGSAAPTHFSVQTSLSLVGPGSAFNFSVTALDAANNPAPTYGGTVHFTSTDPLASLPANSTLTNGTGSFSATLNTLGYQTITATDTVTPSITGTSNAVHVFKLTITSGNPPNGTVGVAYGPLNECLPQGFILSASGVFTEFDTWTSTSLPPGLHIGKFLPSPGGGPDCRPGPAVWMIYGTPTQAGVFNNVVITVHFGNTTASATYMITISATGAAAATRSADSRSTLDSTTAHHHYKLIDMGTLGGPNSIVNEVFYEIDNGTAGARMISDQGVVAGQADTSTPDPLCFADDCFYPNTFQWRDGTLTSLGALPGAQWSSPNWMSGGGMIAGISETGENDPLLGWPNGHAVLWRDGQIIDLGTLPGGYESFAWGVNELGQVVGDATNTTVDPYSYYYATIAGIGNGTQTRAFLWDEQNGMQDLGTLGGPDAWAALVNERGQVAGISYTSATPNPDNGSTCAGNVPPQDPFVWEKSTGMVDIGSFGGTCGAPQAMNNRGQVVGGSYLAGNTVVHAFQWDKRGHPRMKDLGTLGGDNSVALWVDDRGDVVGYADVPNPSGCSGAGCVHHAVLWRNGAATDLGSIGTDPCSRAISVNAGGQIVGFTVAVCGTVPTRGFLWENGGPAIDLNTLVNTDMALLYPLYINDRGEIAGNGVLTNGDTHPFLLIPCDENHAGVEGCDYSMVDAAEAVREIAAPAMHKPTTAPRTLRPFGRRGLTFSPGQIGAPKEAL